MIYSREEDNKGNGGWNSREDAGWLKDSTQNNMPKEANVLKNVFWANCSFLFSPCSFERVP